VHTLVQGSSGFGKSTLTYAQLAPLAGRPDVLVAGLDPSGLVFRPWEGLPGASWRVSGLGGALAEHTRVLAELCAELDRRLELLPPGVDNLMTSPATPLLVVALEELSGFLRTLDADRKLAPTVRALLGRLFAEGRKVGIRMLAVIPRADATVLGAGIRDQCQLRVSFAVEPEGFRMAHPSTGPIDADEHAGSPPGVAAVTAPGLGTFRMRAGALPYAEYCRRVAAADTSGSESPSPVAAAGIASLGFSAGARPHPTRTEAYSAVPGPRSGPCGGRGSVRPLGASS
jgi:S-DNA-T family DNA segregation ATPase FtsK/SpoIIIE